MTDQTASPADLAGTARAPQAGRGPWVTALRKLRSDGAAMLALLLFLLIVALCLLAPFYAAHISKTDPFRSNLSGKIVVDGETVPIMATSTEGLGLGFTPIGPTWDPTAYMLGADSQGRDVAARLLYGGRNSLLIAGASTLICLFLAAIVGLVTGFFGGWVDWVLSRCLDVLWAFPVYLLAISLSIVLISHGIDIGPISINSGSLALPIFIIGIIFVPYVARPIRGQVLALKESEFVLAAVGLGVPAHRILFRDILPNVTTTLIVFVPLLMAINMVTEFGPVFSFHRRPTARCKLGHHHPGRPGLALHPADGGAGTGHCHRADGVDAQRVRRRLAGRPRSPLQAAHRNRLMLLTLIRRIGQMLFVMFGISVLVFLIFFATPGSDPAARIAGRNASPETLQAVRLDFGLDKPLPVQYARMMSKLFITRDLTSFVNRGWKVIPAVLDVVPVTLSLVIGGAILWMIGGIAIGLIAAATRGSLLDRSLMILGLIGVSMPVYWLGEVMNLLTQSRLHDTWLFSWVPPLGYKPLLSDPAGWFLTLVVPWVTLAVLYMGLYGRVLRANLVEAGQEDYIRTARAKGLSETRILVRHALRTSLVTIVTLFGLDFGALVGGAALLTEVVFGLQGIGKLTYDALKNLDLPIIMATVMYASFFVVTANALVDMVYVVLDPRVRTRERGR